MTENDEGPMDNNRKKLIQLNKNKVYNTEINNMFFYWLNSNWNFVLNK